MADYYSHACFSFSCSHAEMALLEEALQACSDLCTDVEPGSPSADLAALFPAVDADPWSGLRAIFSDPAYPALGVELTASNAAGAATSDVILSAEVSFEPYDLACLIQRCCQAALAAQPIGFEWANTCSRQRVDGFSGGWCAVFPDRIEIENTGTALAAALAGGIV